VLPSRGADDQSPVGGSHADASGAGNRSGRGGNDGTSIQDAAVTYNNAQFAQFMPGYSQTVSKVNTNGIVYNK